MAMSESRIELREHLAANTAYLRSIIARVSGRQADLDDLTQACCLHILEKENLRPTESATLQWLGRVARNFTLNQLRDRMRRRRKETPMESMDHVAVPAREGYSEEQIEWILRQFVHLPESQRDLLRLKYFEGLSNRVIGERLNLTPQAVSARLEKAMQALRRRAELQGWMRMLLPVVWLESLTTKGISMFVQHKLAAAAVMLLAVFALNAMSLAEQGTVGVVTDSQGLVHVRPVQADRWSYAGKEYRIEHGDWVKTGPRGPNLASLRLDSGVELILGPDGLLEFENETTLKLYTGVLDLKVPEGETITVRGPKGGSVAVTGARVLAASESGLSALQKDPKWLEGYKTDSTKEAMGELVAMVDGRNVPLTMGYHKVTVDIQDQIARTQIEESFINNTSTVLEGVFYFPLPQDASISSFAMWIGDEMVEGDIVEKQRALAIYEEILREKRDPGLLEWAGGNMFKARVYPIDREKRIRITYTQVLPRTGDSYRYSYAMKSEMLRANPLQQLQLTVNLRSTEALNGVRCDSHETRTHSTEHSAKLEFSASDYTPDRDFEVTVNTAPQKSPIVAIPHLRDTDGYFMVLLSAPDKAELSGRPVLRNSDPLNLCFLVDTSGSITPAQREMQFRTLESILSSLGEKDSFNLATCDVDTRFAFERPEPVTAAAVARAVAFAEKRVPLGWSDLDLAFERAVDRSPAGAHIVYLGDGIPSTGDADPVAQADRLRKKLAGKQVTGHAIGIGSTYESGVLKAIAGKGGAMYAVSDALTAASTAQSFLEEITTPALRDIQVRIEGIQVAALYPETLPNLPAGRQQVLLGRYLPQGDSLQGKVIVTGTLAGEAVRYETAIAMASDDTGNSFIPRLWARSHLDHLLAQGSSQEIKDRIIAMSEDFQIITPYTSFLVLESDADRERFKVEKRFRMRDGEDFFASARDAVNQDLLREQFLVAKRWRLNLQRSFFDYFKNLGRERAPEVMGLALGDMGLLGMSRTAQNDDMDYEEAKYSEDELEWSSGDEGPGEGSFGGRAGGNVASRSHDLGDVMPDESEMYARPEPNASPKDEVGNYDEEYEREDGDFKSNDKSLKRLERRKRANNEDGRGFVGGRMLQSESSLRNTGSPTLDNLFPRVPAAPLAFKEEWPEAVRTALAAYDRVNVLNAIPGAWKFEKSSWTVDARDRKIPSGNDTMWLAANEWLRIDARHRQAETAYWLAGGARGVANLTLGLASSREAKEGDLLDRPVPVPYLFGSIEQFMGRLTPTLKTLDNGHLLLSMTAKNDDNHRYELEFDPERKVVLEYRHLIRDVTRGRVVYLDFKQVGEQWWPGRHEVFNEEGKLVSGGSCAVSALGADDFKKEVGALQGRLAKAILLPAELPKLPDAKAAVAAGKANVADRWTLMLWATRRQQWDSLQSNFEAVSALEAGKPGLTPIELEVLGLVREREAQREKVLVLARELAAAAVPQDWYLADRLENLSNGFSVPERFEILSALEPVFQRQDPIYEAVLDWQNMIFYCLRGMNRGEEAFRMLEGMQTQWPADFNVQRTYINELAQRGEIDAAVAHVQSCIESRGPWRDSAVSAFRCAAASLLLNAYRLKDYIEYVDAHEGDEPFPFRYNSIYNQYLSALLMTDRVRDADERIADWLQLTPGEEDKSITAARFEGALEHCTGNGWNMYYYHRTAHPKWNAALRDLTVRLVEHEHLWEFVRTVFDSNRFSDSRECVERCAAMRADIDAHLADWPLRKLCAHVDWLAAADWSPESTGGTWEPALTKLYERWESEEVLRDRQAAERVILWLGDEALRLRLYRALVQRADEGREQNQARLALLAALQGATWTKEIQQECAALLPLITDDVSWIPEDGDRKTAELTGQLNRLMAFVDAMLERQYQFKDANILDRGKIGRRALVAAQEAIEKEVRADLRDTLRGMEGGYAVEALRPWIRLERIRLDVLLKQDLAAADVSFCRDTLTALPENSDLGEIAVIDAMLAQRCVDTLAWNALQSGIPAEQAEWLHALADKRIEAEGVLYDWRLLKYMLLVCQDRGDDAVALLRGWVDGRDPFKNWRWRIDYGYLLAERGDLDAAIRMFEAIQKDDELGAEQYENLSNWYLVKNELSKSDAAKIRSYEVMEEWRLSNLVSNVAYSQNSRRRGDDEAEVPQDLDKETPLRLIALLRKTSSPENYVYYLQMLYAGTKDFRVLECLPEGVTGHTAVGMYGYLSRLSGIFEMIGDEATTDRILGHLAPMIAAETNPVDKRALIMMQFLIEARAAGQAHGADAYLQRALDTLETAFRDEWSNGEASLMSTLLCQQTSIARKEILSLIEQKLDALYVAVEAGSEDRVHIAYRYCQFLMNLRKGDKAQSVLGPALEEYRSTQPSGLLPNSVFYAFNYYLSVLQGNGEFKTAEAAVRRELALPYNPAVLLDFKRSLYQTYLNAFSMRAAVELADGGDLFAPLVRLLRKDLLEYSNENHCQQVLSQYVQVFKTETDRNPGSLRAREELRALAFQWMPEILSLYQYRSGQAMIGRVADALGSLDPKAALEFLIIRCENEPRWLEFVHQDFWRNQGWRTARLRAPANAGKDLEDRLLAQALGCLRDSLEQRDFDFSAMFYRNNDVFWAAKADEFHCVAREVLEANADEENAVAYVSSYLYKGLHDYAGAIAAMRDAYSKGLLGYNSQNRLASWYVEQQRWLDGAEFAATMLKTWPEYLAQHLQLIQCLGGAGKTEARDAAMASAIALFKGKDGGWHENVVAQLAGAGLEGGMHEVAAGLYDECIRMRLNARGGRTSGDSRLSQYYTSLSRCHSKLGNTAAAVDAASGAIVCWPRGYDNREEALNNLEMVLRSAKDFAGYVEAFVAKVESSNQENPVLRRAIGKICLERKDYAGAIRHLRAALEVQPNDTELYASLLTAYDKNEDAAGAIACLLESRELSGHDLALLVELGDRYAKAGDKEQAERAYTTLAEAMPQEADGHMELADLREEQQRWSDAEIQWRQVVRLRADDPHGVLGLSRSLIELKQFDEAESRLRKLLAAEWPERFGDVHYQARTLLETITR